MRYLIKDPKKNLHSNLVALLVMTFACLYSTPALASTYDKYQPLIIQGALKNDITKVKKALIRGNTTETRHKSTGDTALHIASAKGNQQIVYYLLEQKSATSAENKDGNTALHMAAKNSQLSVMKMLLSAKADVNAQNKLGETALIIAARNTKSSVIKLLLKNNADKDIEDLTGLRAIDYAQQSRRPELADLLEE